MKDLKQLLQTAAQQGASDLHIKVGSPPIMRLHGKLVPIDAGDRVSYEDTMKMSLAVMSPGQRDAFKKRNDLDFAYSVAGLGRFRCNLFVQRGAVGAVFRTIPMKVPSVEELNLPDIINRLAQDERGLIVVTGTTGSGKSTTLASIIDYINTNRSCNIVTIEDPIEYLHRDKRSIVNQREVGTDTRDFATALRAALRQDPDVILVGEMRDVETMETAMAAAETGHLVLSTLHTIDATETVNRIISSFPPHQHSQIRTQLSSIIKGIISMRLMPRADGNGRVPAVEVLLATSLIRECIVDTDKTKLIRDYIAQGKLHYGMQTFDQSILDHMKKGLIKYEEALKWVTNVDDFKLKVKGIHSTAEMSDEGELEGLGTTGDIENEKDTGGFKGVDIDRFSK
jgi:twitching motility protein PilT